MKRKIDSDKCYRSTVKLICNSQMAKELDRCFDYSRYCWNKMLEIEKTYQKLNSGKRLKPGISLKQLRDIRNTQDWQLKLPAYILGTTSNNLMKTITNIIKHNYKVSNFKKLDSSCDQKYKFIRFKSKKKTHKSVIIPNDRILKVGVFQKKGNRYTFGICLGGKSVVDPKYRMMEITELPQGLKEGTARILSVTIFKKYGEYYASFNMEILKPKTFKQASGLIGIDPGLKTTLTLSNRVKISYPKKIKKLISKAEYYQSRMDKRYVKGKKIQSKRYYSARTKFWRTLKRIANLKKDWIHKVTTKLAKTYHTTKWEDVEPEKMIKTKKKNLAKSIGQASWSTIRRILENKLKVRHGILTLVPCQAASTQTCNKCGYVRKGEEKLTLSDRIFTCPHCGYTEDRDINAAKNIAKYLQFLTVCG